MDLNNWNLGDCVDNADFPEAWGDELTFELGD